MTTFVVLAILLAIILAFAFHIIFSAAFWIFIGIIACPRLTLGILLCYFAHPALGAFAIIVAIIIGVVKLIDLFS